MQNVAVTCVRGVETGVNIGIYTPQVNFLWGKNDIRTAIQQFYTPPPKKKKQISGYAPDMCMLNNISSIQIKINLSTILPNLSS